MNFIVRNLGWILLIIFFIFMLYLISNQDNIKKDVLVNSGSISTGSIILEKTSNKLEIVKKDNSDENKKINEDDSEGGILDSVRNFFTLDSNKKEKNDEVQTSTGKVTEKLISKVKDKAKVKAKAKEKIKVKKEQSEITINFTGEVNKNVILKNNNKIIDSNKIKKEIKKLPVSEKVKEKIEKRNKQLHTVGVHSVALNNAYFTKKLGYAYKGDKLEQITNTNKYGCFNSEVLESKKSMGKKGWTCIYYMEGHLNEMGKYQKESVAYYKKLRSKTISKKKVQNKIKYSNLAKKEKIDRAEDGSVIITKDPHRVYEGPTYNTEVGSLYLVRVNSLILNDETFTTQKGYLETCTYKNCDVLEQLTPVDKNGCFKVNVFMSKYNKNKRGWVCQKYLR